MFYNIQTREIRERGKFTQLLRGICSQKSEVPNSVVSSAVRNFLFVVSFFAFLVNREYNINKLWQLTYEISVYRRILKKIP